MSHLSKELRLMLTRGDDDEIVAAMSVERYPNELGAITPPVTVEHEGVEYILKRKWDMLPDTYIYRPSQRISIDDLLD